MYDDCSVCILLLPLWDSVIVLCFVVRYFVSNHLDEEERTNCFALFVFLVSLPHNATGLSAVCDSGIS